MPLTETIPSDTRVSNKDDSNEMANRTINPYPLRERMNRQTDRSASAMRKRQDRSRELIPNIGDGRVGPD